MIKFATPKTGGIPVDIPQVIFDPIFKHYVFTDKKSLFEIQFKTNKSLAIVTGEGTRFLSSFSGTREQWKLNISLKRLFVTFQPCVEKILEE